MDIVKIVSNMIDCIDCLYKDMSIIIQLTNVVITYRKGRIQL